MKKSIFFLVFIAYSTLIAQDGGELCSKIKMDQFKKLYKSTSLAYPGDSNIDVKYYKLDLKLQVNPNGISGVITITAKSTVNNLTNVILDLKANLAVSSIVCSGNNLVFSQADDKINITLNRTYSSGEEFTLLVTYSGVPSAGGGFISNASISFRDSNAGKDVIASLSEPYGSKDWWPCKDDPADKADSSDVWITADSWFTSVSNGSLEEVVTNGDGTKTYKWKNHYPIAPYLISIAMTNYYLYQDTWEYSPGKFLPLTHYCYPERWNDTRKNAVDQTKSMLSIFSDKFGLYPYIKEKYGHAEFSWGGGMEHQTITSMGGGAMSSIGTIAHELAHQWFGDKVTCKDWQNIWLNEGFAEYCESIYNEGIGGRTAYLNKIRTDMNGARNAQGTLYVQNITSENEIFNFQRSYQKGSVVVHMLRGVVADSGKFFTILRNYLNDPALSYGVATTEDLQRHAESVTGQNLQYFFNEWVYGENFPKYTINWSRIITDIANAQNVSVTIQQTTDTPNPGFFTMPVQLKFSTTTGDTTITVFNNQNNQTFYFSLKGNPTNLEFDPDEWILKNVISITQDPDYIGPAPTEYGISQNFPNPFNTSTSIRYFIAKDCFISIKIYNMLGQEVIQLYNGIRPAGYYFANWSGTGFPSGFYTYKYEAIPTDGSKSFMDIKKMILLK